MTRDELVQAAIEARSEEGVLVLVDTKEDRVHDTSTNVVQVVVDTVLARLGD